MKLTILFVLLIFITGNTLQRVAFKKRFTSVKLRGNRYIMFHKLRVNNSFNVLTGISFFQVVGA